jgi:hypothetical protein
LTGTCPRARVLLSTLQEPPIATASVHLAIVDVDSGAASVLVEPDQIVTATSIDVAEANVGTIDAFGLFELFDPLPGTAAVVSPAVESSVRLNANIV